MGRRMKAQSALEFMITYSWAIVALLAFMAALAYFGQFNGLNYTPSECSAGLDLPCMTYRISQSNVTGYEVLLMGRNDLGFDIGFENQTFNVSSENLGWIGRNSSIGNCSPSVVRRGQVFSCFATIPSSERAPRIGSAQRAYFLLGYKNCDTNPSYSTTGNCSATLTVNHTVAGWLVAQVEPSTSGGVRALCGNGVCDDNLGETNLTCSDDCTPISYTLILTANPSRIGYNTTSVITATVYDQFRRPVNNTLLNFTKDVGSGSFSASSNTTNASGVATTVFRSGFSSETVTIYAYRDDWRTFSATTQVITAGWRWNQSFAYAAPISIFTGVSSNLTNFPARVIVDTYSLISAGKMNSSCKDLRVVNSTLNGTLDFEIENNTCDTTSTVLWVRIPQTNGTQSYPAYLFYGNMTVADAQNKTGVWSNNYSAVYHLSDLADSTGRNNLTKMGQPNLTAGQLSLSNTAFLVSSTPDFLSAGNDSSLNTATFAIEFWTMPTRNYTTEASQYFGGVAKDNNYRLGWQGWTDGWTVDFYDPTRRYTDSSNVYEYNNTWSFVAGMYNGTYLFIFRNGTQVKNASLGAYTPQIVTTNLTIGKGPSTTYWNGIFDEVRISNVSRSGSWLYAEYAQTSSVGSEQSNR